VKNRQTRNNKSCDYWLTGWVTSNGQVSVLKVVILDYEHGIQL